MVCVNQMLHTTIKFITNSQRIFDDHLLQVFNGPAAIFAARKLRLPHGSALKFISGEDVIHNVSVQVLQNGFLVDIRSEELGVNWIGSACYTKEKNTKS